ncbi:anti-sigma regulatory factor [Neobacillus sp. YIM B06451]|uniref:anti-sigma regulatory factor n=1 Tax=Neobacillus sp. YIM B06451 TaxID=3070994 RepID=UPI00292DCA59|nr:anti-sigma regulatory factor [Neobacillus sp. YIM B06451]
MSQDCLLHGHFPDKPHIEIKTESDIMSARRVARELAKELGFSAFDQSRIITLISELARNIFKYAGRGYISIETIKGRNGAKGVKIHAIDCGPGILNVNRALEQGYSTSGSLGAGLPAIKRMADEFSIQTAEGKGTYVKITKWLN